MIALPEALRNEKLDARMLLQVHDELIFKYPKNRPKKFQSVIVSVMQFAHLPAIELSVPLIAEAGIGHSWADAH